MPDNQDDGRELGYAGLLAAGKTPEEAWQVIRDDAAQPGARAIFGQMESTPEGRAALDCARQAWARHGMPAPFDDLPPGGSAETP